MHVFKWSAWVPYADVEQEIGSPLQSYLSADFSWFLTKFFKILKTFQLLCVLKVELRKTMRIEVGCFYPKELFRVFSDERIFGKFQSPVGISLLLLIQADIL